jgi:hypothetical protein
MMSGATMFDPEQHGIHAGLVGAILAPLYVGCDGCLQDGCSSTDIATEHKTSLYPSY